MDLDTKKNLASNWFKTLQNALCESIIKLENSKSHPLITKLKKSGNPGFIAFTSGTSGPPKAILHDFKLFLKRFETPRPALRTINFLSSSIEISLFPSTG